MASIILNSDTNYVVFYRNGYNDERYIQRDGYKCKINDFTLFHFYDKPTDPWDLKYIWDHRTTPEEAFKILGYNINTLENHIQIEVDPWICFFEGSGIVLYFGKDKPVLKTKIAKIETKHLKMWTGGVGGNWVNKQYKYWDVKNKSKLLFCGQTGIDRVFPEYNWRLYEPHGKLKRMYIGPFKASDPYDYTRFIKR